MQSFLQYRRFRRHLQQQIDSHGLEAVAAVTRTETSDPTRTTLHQRVDTDLRLAKSHSLGVKNTGSDGSTLASRMGSPFKRNIDLNSTGSSGHNHSSSAASSQTDVANQQDLEKQTPDDNTPPTAAKPTSEQGNIGRFLDSMARYNTVHEDRSEDGRDGGQTRTRLAQQMSGISVRSKDDKNYFVVGFHGDNDPLNPHNWSKPMRILYTGLVCLISFIVGVASSIDSAVIPQSSETFGVSQVVGSLATATYLIGFGCGAFTTGPVSETVGRSPVYLVTMFLFMVFIMAAGLSPNIGAQLTFRFFAGFFGTTPLTCAGGTMSDMWNALERTVAFPVFANASFFGPMIAPIIGGWIGQTIDWRWCEWVTLIASGTIFIAVVLFLPETYAPMLLKWKVEHLRQLTGDDRYVSELEIRETKFVDRLLHNLYRPWLLLFLEPIVMLFTIYLTVVYIVFFTFLTGYQYIFQATYGLSQGLTYTIFAALAIGIWGASALVPYVTKRYKRKLEETSPQGQTSLPPEERLIFAMIGAPFLPIGIFWMGWTAYPFVSVWSPIAANLVVGFAILTIFISTYQYLIDCFETYAASALVGITFVRYMAAGGMIPVSIPFYQNLGVHWTLTVMGGISAILTPVPYVFYYYGTRIRQSSRYAVGKN